MIPVNTFTGMNLATISKLIPCTLRLMKQPLAQRTYILNYKTTLLAERVTVSIRES